MSTFLQYGSYYFKIACIHHLRPYRPELRTTSSGPIQHVWNTSHVLVCSVWMCCFVFSRLWRTKLWDWYRWVCWAALWERWRVFWAFWSVSLGAGLGSQLCRCSWIYLPVSARVCRSVNTKETNWQKSSFFISLLTIIDFISQERTAPSTLMSVSPNPARMEVAVRIRSMATPVHALLGF